jgi:O-succinylbenzoic acid--CoA ligase
MAELVQQLKAAIADGRPFALADPAWPAQWRARMQELADAFAGGPAVLVPTSGSSGMPKYCIHDIDTLRAAARGFASWRGAGGVTHAVNVLPLFHIGGLMPHFRCAETGGAVHAADYRSPRTLTAAPFPLGQAAISLVPTQLRRMLAGPDTLAVLRRFGLILVGGAHCPADVLKNSRQAGLRLAPCYGATETAAMVAALEPEAFLGGAGGVGRALSHATIDTDPAGRVRVRSAAVMRGYFPAAPGFCRDPFVTGDLGEFDADGGLRILGRSDRVIITGGKNVHPEQVEAALLATGLASRAQCRGVPDPDWGQRVEAWVVPAVGAAPTREQLRQALRERLPAHAIPKALHLDSGPADGADGWIALKNS